MSDEGNEVNAEGIHLPSSVVSDVLSFTVPNIIDDTRSMFIKEGNLLDLTEEEKKEKEKAIYENAIIVVKSKAKICFQDYLNDHLKSDFGQGERSVITNIEFDEQVDILLKPWRSRFNHNHCLKEHSASDSLNYNYIEKETYKFKRRISQYKFLLDSQNSDPLNNTIRENPSIDKDDSEVT